MYVVAKAYSKVGIKEIAAQNWVCLNAHQFNYIEHASHSVSGINRQLATYLAVKLWHSVTDKSSAMLSSHTYAKKREKEKKKKEKKKSTATTSSLPFHQSSDKVDCPYQMLAGSRHYINLVEYNYEINKIIKDGLPTLKGIVRL